MLKNKYTPVSAIWEITLDCNMHCIHCGSSAGNARENELSTKEAINVCKKLNQLGTGLITLIGGEPFLRKDWNRIAKEIKDYGMDVTIISNGFPIDDKLVTQLKKLEPYAVAISLDGALAETHDSIRGFKGSFDKCISSLELLKNADLPTSIITTLHKRNVKELSKIREMILGKGIAWQIQMAGPTGRFPKKLLLSEKEFYSVAMFISSSRNQYSTKELPIMGAHNFGYHSHILGNIMITPTWKGCPAGISTIGITSNGGVKGCLSLPNEFIEDNIRNRSLIDIWNSPNFASYNRNFNKDNLKEECTTCKYGKSCKGGCTTVSSTLSGEPHQNPYCFHLIEQKNEFLIV
jgi:radical SAM protein with 4Fe4S-binding SPASM domain